MNFNILKGNYCILSIDVVFKKCKNMTFKVNFLYQKLSESFSIFFSSIQEHIFCYRHFLITSIFISLYSLKWCPIFDTSPLTQFSKFNNFLWVCWFLGKNISNFVPPAWILDNPYYHNLHINCILFSYSIHNRWLLLPQFYRYWLFNINSKRRIFLHWFYSCDTKMNNLLLIMSPIFIRLLLLFLINEF